MKWLNYRGPLPTSDNFIRRLPLYRLLAAALILVAVCICSVQQIWRRDGDPYLFLDAARRFMHGQDLYLLTGPHGNYYYYPPFFAFLSIPLTAIPETMVVVLWALASVCLLGWSMVAFYGGMTGQRFFSLPARTRWVVFFISTLLTARFTILHLRFGQTNILVLALAVLGLSWFTRKHDVHAGVAIGLSIAVKLTTLPFVFWFLARRSGKVMLGIALGVLIGAMLPALIIGFNKNVDYHREWVQQVALANSPGTGSWAGIGNISLRAQADRFFLNVPSFAYKNKLYGVTIVALPVPIVRLMGQLAMLCVALAIGFYAIRFRKAPELVSEWGGFAFVLSLIPNFSLVAEIPHLVLLVPAYIYVVHVWYFRLTTDRLFRSLVLLSFVFTTLTTKGIWGQFAGGVLASLGVVSWGMLLLSAAIFRAATCMERTLPASLLPARANEQEATQRSNKFKSAETLRNS
jgi:hypothetical protein